MEWGEKSGRNGTPVPQSRVTLSASTRTYLLTGSSAEMLSVAPVMLLRLFIA